MRERDYVLASQIARVRAIKQLLRDAVPCSEHDQMDEAEWQGILRSLTDWEERLVAAIDEDDEIPCRWWCGQCARAFTTEDIEHEGGFEDAEKPKCPQCDDAVEPISQVAERGS